MRVATAMSTGEATLVARPAAVPEPGIFGLMCSGLILLAMLRPRGWLRDALRVGFAQLIAYRETETERCTCAGSQNSSL